MSNKPEILIQLSFDPEKRVVVFEIQHPVDKTFPSFKMEFEPLDATQIGHAFIRAAGEDNPNPTGVVQ